MNKQKKVDEFKLIRFYLRYVAIPQIDKEIESRRKFSQEINAKLGSLYTFKKLRIQITSLFKYFGWNSEEYFD